MDVCMSGQVVVGRVRGGSLEPQLECQSLF